jgi:hypothetical protein
VTRSAFKLVLCVLALLAGAWAQSTIEGTVKARNGQAVPNAHIVLRHLNGNVAEESTSDAAGTFRLAAQEAGAYELIADAPGFFAAQYHFIARPRQPVRLDAELEPKTAVVQSVEVRSTFTAVDPEKTGSSQTFTRQQL